MQAMTKQARMLHPTAPKARRPPEGEGLPCEGEGPGKGVLWGAADWVLLEAGCGLVDDALAALAWPAWWQDTHFTRKT